MALDLAASTTSVADAAPPGSIPPGTGRRSPPPRATSTPRSAADTSAPCGTTRATCCARGGTPIRIATKSVRVRERDRGPPRPAGLPRRARLHARRGALARRDHRRRRRRLPHGGARRHPPARRPTPTSRRRSRSWSTRRSSSTSSTPCCRRRARGDPRSASSSTRRGHSPVLGHLGVRRSPVHDPGRRGRARRVHRRPPGIPARRHDVLRGADRGRREPARRAPSTAR